MTNLHGIYECNSTIALPFLMEFMKRGADKVIGIYIYLYIYII